MNPSQLLCLATNARTSIIHSTNPTAYSRLAPAVRVRASQRHGRALLSSSQRRLSQTEGKERKEERSLGRSDVRFPSSPRTTYRCRACACITTVARVSTHRVTREDNYHGARCSDCVDTVRLHGDTCASWGTVAGTDGFLLGDLAEEEKGAGRE